MNRITTHNAADLTAQIMAQAATIAAQTKPVANVRISSGTGITIAEALDLDSTSSGNDAVIRVADGDVVRARLVELRREASTTLKRTITKFTTALTEAEAEAQRSHVIEVARESRRVTEGGGEYDPNRPLRNFSITGMVDAHTAMVDWLATQEVQQRIPYGNLEGEEFHTHFNGVSDCVSVTTTPRVRWDSDSDQPIIRYRHTLNVSGGYDYADAIRVIKNVFSNRDSILVKRYNKISITGGAKHFEKFCVEAITLIEEELDARMADVAAMGMTLILTTEAVDYTAPAIETADTVSALA